MLGFFGSVDTVLHQSLHEAVFGMEFLLTFMIVLTYLRVTQHYDSLMAATAVGVSYMAATMSFRAAVNPAFALGRAFVVNDFGRLWIFWVGPLLGGVAAALCHEFIFSDQRDVTVSMTNLSDQPQPSDSDSDDFETRLVETDNRILFCLI